MTDRPERQSALVHLGTGKSAGIRQAGGSGAALAAAPYRTQVSVRGDGSDERFRNAVGAIIGAPPPLEPNTVAGPADLTDGARILWLGPDEWLVVAADADADLAATLNARLAGTIAAAIDVSDARAVFCVSGPRARDLLSRGCPLDLHPRVFSPGRCAQTLMAKAHVILHQRDEVGPGYDLYVQRSLAAYLWTWLSDAAAEFDGPAEG